MKAVPDKLTQEKQQAPLSSAAASSAHIPESAERILESQREVFDFMEQGVVVWTADDVCSLVNARFYELCELSIEDLNVGMPRADYYERIASRGGTGVTTDQASQINRNVATKKPFTFDRQIGERKLSVTVRPLATGGVVATFTDMSDVRKQEASLRAAIERAVEAERHARETLAFESERKSEANRLSEFGDWLQSCKTITELYEVVRQAMISIHPGSRGELFIYSNSRDVLEGVTSWGSANVSTQIQSQDCWALRRGRMYRYGDGIINFRCNHVDEAHAHDHETGVDNDLAYLCLPIIAHGDTVGLLHVDLSCIAKDNDEKGFFSVEHLAFITRCAEQISMAVANVKLRDELHEQSTRDPLTNLFNRRYFLERCRAELQRAECSSTPLSMLVFDADNFKQFNDRFGHDAGDVVLCNIADLAQRRFNADDEVTARIGGEEFAVLIPGLNLEELERKVQGFIDDLSAQSLNYLHKTLPNVSVSAGIAVYGLHGNSLSELVRESDNAMYAAKKAGKNRYVIAGT